MTKRFEEGDLVQYKDQDTQREHEEENPPPFSVCSSEMKDLYDSGLPGDCWEEVTEVQDSNDEVFDTVEADELRKVE